METGLLAISKGTRKSAFILLSDINKIRGDVCEETITYYFYSWNFNGWL